MLLSLLLSVGPLAPTVAYAQDEGFLEDEGNTSGKSRRRSSSLSEGTVKEVTRGIYAKADVGGLGYVGLFGTSTNPGIMVNLGVGQDFVDQEKLSMSWELDLSQGVNGGADYFTQASLGCSALGGAAPCTQGDLRTYALQAFYEVSFYPSRRVGIGIRAGGGLIYSPLFIEANAYQTEVLPEFGLTADPGWHDTPHPLVLGGPTFEYYTKLAHFSVGVDADFSYGIGWGMGWDAAGYLKYTFGRKVASSGGSGGGGSEEE